MRIETDCPYCRKSITIKVDENLVKGYNDCTVYRGLCSLCDSSFIHTTNAYGLLKRTKFSFKDYIADSLGITRNYSRHEKLREFVLKYPTLNDKQRSYYIQSIWGEQQEYLAHLLLERLYK